jgi:hypothetical protein
MSTIIKFFIILIILKGIVWSLLVPLWHFPDEQAHFGHVAYLAEGGSLPLGEKGQLNLSEEIAISEKLLGTFRDERGNNSFTYHPEYRLEYSDSLNGPSEDVIKSLPVSSRSNFVIKESAYYPHFYYRISALIYKVFDNSNLFIRVFSIRLFWLSVSILTIYLSFLISKNIFPKNKLLIITISLATAFQPMLSFVSSGVTSDTLFNLAFALVIYFNLKLLTKFNNKNLIFLMLSLSFGLLIKQQFIIAFLITTPVLLRQLIRNPKIIIKLLLLVLFSVFLTYLIEPELIKGIIDPLLNGKIPYLNKRINIDQARPEYSLLEHTKFTLNHTIREVLPWYWGVFNWLGVVLPRWVNKILMRLIFISGLGIFIKIIKIIKSKKVTAQHRKLIFILWTVLAYFVSLYLWDFDYIKNNGFSFGLQGRYYFPTIISHLVLLIYGLKQIGDLFGQRFSRLLLLLTSLWFIVLNYIGLITVSSAYYDLSSFKSFITQASQYKPWFAKGMWLSSLLIIYFLVSLIFIYILIKFFQKNEK